MIYELINPSDEVTIEAEDDDVARAAALLLGRGQIGLHNERGEEVLPLLVFGGYDEWAARVGFDLAELLKERSSDVAACLRSALCAGVRERAAVKSAVGNDAEAIARFNDERRTSLNDICGAALAAAEAMEKGEDDD